MILVIGNGLVGHYMKEVLQDEGHAVISADYNPGANYTIDATEIDQIKELVDTFKVTTIMCAVPGHIGYQVLKNSIQCGVDVVDISFGPENVLELNDLAAKCGVTAIVDMGLAPGMPGVIAGHTDKHHRLDSIICEVGGIPVEPKAPYFYKAPFSPIDVIEEYTRPARYKETGLVLELNPMSDEANCPSAFKDKYPVEAILTDGLRTMLTTLPHVNSMREITTRDWRHLGLMRSMYHNECFEKDHINDTSETLIEAWRYLPDEKDRVLFNLKLIDIKGEKTVWEMEDVATSEASAMARTTGLVATGSLNFLLTNKDKFQPGIITPEMLGKIDGALEFLINYQSNHNIIYKKL